MQEQENSRQQPDEAPAGDVQEQSGAPSEQNQPAQVMQEETAQMPAGAKESDALAKQADETEDGETASTYEKLFTLKFHLPLDDYIEFYRVMTADSIDKNKKRMTICLLYTSLSHCSRHSLYQRSAKPTVCGTAD